MVGPEFRSSVRCRVALRSASLAILLFSVVAAPAVAQSSSTSLFVNVGALIGATPLSSQPGVAVSGDTAVLFGIAPGVQVFDRQPGGDQWIQTTTLMPSDGTPGFGDAAATDGSTIVVGAEGAVFIFQHPPGGGPWVEVAKLTAVVSRSAAVSGRTVVVRASVGGPGAVYVFEQDEIVPNIWTQVARLTGPISPDEPVDQFGSAVAIDGDTAVIAGLLGPDQLGAHVFSRHHGGPNAWGRVAELPPSVTGGIPVVALSGDTAVLDSNGPGGVRIFERDHGGANAWGEVHSIDVRPFGNVAISGDLLAVGRLSCSPLGAAAVVYARNQGGKDSWGEVARMPATGGSADCVSFAAFSLSLDTAIMGGDVILCPLCQRRPIVVHVADVDRDGIRDGADPCPRDPFNNVAGGCQRSSAAYAVLDDLIALDDVATETRGEEFHIRATFTNASGSAIGNPFFEVTELTGGNVLNNGDAGPGGAAATLSPDVGDGLLSPGESMTVAFVIGLETRDAFRFHVSVRGEVGP